MRNNFAEELHALALEDSRVILLSGDIGNRLFDRTKDAAADRVINCGVAEQNMMGVASGLAQSGFRPVVYTITPFTTYRCFEQIRVDVCYHEAPVTIVGTGAGLSYASLGPTHHSMEDVAIMRTLPGMTVFCPSDPGEVRSGLRAALQQEGPVYIRLGKKGEPNLHVEPSEVRLGRAETMREGTDICLIASGPVLGLALSAADELSSHGISARVENFHTIKPLDTERLKEIEERFRVALTIEEHGRIGGLFGAVAEWLASRPDSPLSLRSVGSNDEFLHNIGSQTFARNAYDISTDVIVSLSRRAIDQ